MPTYQITAPNGKTYRIEGPEGATDEQIRAEVLRQFPDADPTVRTNPTVRGPDIQDEPKSTMQHLGAGVQNAAASAVEGVVAAPYDFGMGVSSGINRGVNYALSEGGATILNALGAAGAADWLRNAGQTSRNALAQTGGGAVDAVERISPTPEGMGAARLTGQITSSLLVPFGPRVTPRQPALRPPNPAREVIEAGEREGVRVMTSDVAPPRTFIGKLTRAAGERIPIAGTGGSRVKQNEERIEAVRNLAREFGVEGSQEILEEVADDLAKTRGARLTALTRRKDQVIDGIRGSVETPQAVAAIDEQIARLRGINEAELGPVIRNLERFRGVLTSGRSLREIEENRKLLGAMFEDQSLASVKTVGQKAINAIYKPLRDDMGAFIKANGGEKAFGAWKRSNDELAAMAGELDAGAFKRVLNNAETTPENVASLLFSKKPSDVRRLFGNLSPAGQEKARAAVIYEAIKKSGGIEEISPQKFATAMQRFGDTVGITFGKDAPRVEGLVRLLKATQRASEASAAPPTGVQNTPIIGAAILTEWLGSAGSSLAAGGIAGMAARLYESAPVRNLLVNLGKTKPGSRAESAVLQRIGSVLVSQGQIRTSANAVNDNAMIAARAVAEDNQGQD